ncbi:DUF3618 domain-containing protein [Actinokineospora pegani]|uniref:DUF3618 domain-containing protein n=1 Tax=Actinokineospora pegani TaxID=2654637 RepID=UPI0012EA890A|nr:DUF3618 domain-containing protein [Actinokineospora pegani]
MSPSEKKALAADIEEAREELADTVDALVAKTDVKKRVGDKADEVKATVAAKAAETKDKVAHARDTVVAKAAEAKEKATDGTAADQAAAIADQAKVAAGELTVVAKRNPAQVAGIAALVAVIIALILRSRSR